MKRIKIFLLLFSLITSFSVNAMSLKQGPSHNDSQRHTDKDKGQEKQKPVCGVPLDGGLLTVLGVAGVGYYTARKKGKKLES